MSYELPSFFQLLLQIHFGHLMRNVGLSGWWTPSYDHAIIGQVQVCTLGPRVLQMLLCANKINVKYFENTLPRRDPLHYDQWRLLKRIDSNRKLVDCGGDTAIREIQSATMMFRTKGNNSAVELSSFN